MSSYGSLYAPSKHNLGPLGLVPVTSELYVVCNLCMGGVSG